MPSWLPIVFLVAAACVGVWFFSADVAAIMDIAATWIFGKFEDEHTPLVLAAGILAAGASLAVGYLLYVGSLVLHVRALRRHVRRYDQATFAEEFDTVSSRLERNRLIGHSWTEFRETVVRRDDPPTVQNTVRPQAFINTQHLQQERVALRFMPHLPNYFVGVGLLLTFVGLVAALNFATRSVGGDVATAVAGLQDLLAAATFKFWTSIAGLGASIVLSFFFRVYTTWLDGAFNAFCRAVEEKMIFATPQEIFADLRETGREQLAETKKINEEVAFTIGKNVSDSLQQHLPGMLNEALKPVAEQVRQTTDTLAQHNNEGVGAMVDKFAQTMEGSAGAHLQAMSGTLETLQQTLERMQGSMSSSGDEFARRMAEGSERLEATMREVATAVSDLVEQLRAQVASAGSDLGGQLESTLQRIAEQSEAVAEKLAEQGQTASQAFASRVESAAQSLQSSAEQNAAASSAFAEDLRARLQDSVEGLRAGITGLSERLQQVDRTVAAQAEVFDGIVTRSREVSDALSGAAQDVRGSVTPLTEAGQQLAQTTRQLETSVTNTGQQIDQALHTAGQLAQSLTEVSERVRQSWESYQGRFEKVDEDLERAYEKLQSTLQIQEQRLAAFLKDFDSSFTKATEGLSTTVHGINEAAESLSESLEQWVNHTGPNGGSRPSA